MGALGGSTGSDHPAETSVPRGGVGTEAGSTPPPSSPPPSKFKGPELTAENLPQIIEGIDKMIMSGIAVAKAKGVPREIALREMEMPPGDKETLAFFAPYALEYADVVLQYAKPAMAGLFVVFWGMSITSRTKNLASLSEQYRKLAAEMELERKRREVNGQG